MGGHYDLHTLIPTTIRRHLLLQQFSLPRQKPPAEMQDNCSDVGAGTGAGT